MKINFYSTIALILIFILWITPGLFGRDPWKADEPYSFGLVYHIIRTGDWVVPELTGEPFLEKPPLFYLTAGGFGHLLSPPLNLFDATRLAIVFYMFLAFLFFTLTARELYSKEYGGPAAIVLASCILLQEYMHKMITDVALFAGFSIALYGFALSRRRRIGGFWIGTGIGIGFMAKGLLAPGLLGITAVALPLIFPLWRRKDYWISLAIAALAAMPWLIIWPTALYVRSADLFVQFIWYENMGRFFGFGPEAARDSHSYYFVNLLWLTWPVIVPAVWSLWHFRKYRQEHPLYQLPLVFSIATLAVLIASSSNRPLYAVPLLLPLSLIAVPGVDLVPRKMKTIGNWFSILIFAGIALFLWFSWIAMITGKPAAIAAKLHAFQPDYLPQVRYGLLAVAVFYSLAWLFIIVNITHSSENYYVNWTLGIVLAWGLVMTLWLPALNSGSSFGAAFTSLKKSLPVQYSCIARRGLGESERAMLEYYTGVDTIGSDDPRAQNCDLILEQRSGKSLETEDSRLYRKIWTFNHPSINPKDIFTLYKEGPLSDSDERNHRKARN